MSIPKLDELLAIPFNKTDLFLYWNFSKENEIPENETLRMYILILYKNYKSFLDIEKQQVDICVEYSRPLNTLFSTKEERLSLKKTPISLVDLYKELEKENPTVSSLMSIYAMNFLLKLSTEQQLKYQRNKSRNIFSNVLDEPVEFYHQSNQRIDFMQNVSLLDIYLKLAPIIDYDLSDLNDNNEIEIFLKSAKTFSISMNKLFLTDVLIKDMLQEYQEKYSSFADFMYTTSSNSIFIVNDKTYNVQSLYLNPDDYKVHDYQKISPKKSTPLKKDFLSTKIKLSNSESYQFKPFIPFEKSDNTNDDILDTRTYNGVYLLLARAIEVSFKRRVISVLEQTYDKHVAKYLLKNSILINLLISHPNGFMKKILFDSDKPLKSFLSTLYAIPHVEKNINFINLLGLEVNYVKDDTIPQASDKVLQKIFIEISKLNEFKNQHLQYFTKTILSRAYGLILDYERENHTRTLLSSEKKISTLEHENQKLKKRVTSSVIEKKKLNDELREKRKLLSDSTLFKEKQLLENKLLHTKNEFTKFQLNTEEKIHNLQSQYTEEIKNLKNDKEYDQKKSNELISELKLQIKALGEKNLELVSKSKRTIAEKPSNKEVSFEEWLNQGKFLLESPNKDEYQHQIFNLIKDYVNINVTSIEVEKSFTNRIGYVLLEGQDTYVIFADGTKILLTDIPNDTFLSDYQFVRVGKEGKYLYLYYYSFTERYKDKFVQEYGVVEAIEENQLTIRGLNDEIYTVQYDINNMKHIKINTIIGYKRTTDSIEIMRIYDRLYVNLDVIHKSILQKGLSTYIYVKTISNGLIMLNVATNQEEFISVKENEEHPISKLREGEVIILHKSEDNAIVRTFHPNFYKFSSAYPHSQVAIINRIDSEDERIFVEKQNHEIVLMNNVPYQTKLEVGTNVMIDENNNFLQFYKQFKYNQETLEKRIASSSANIKPNREKTELPPITKKVAIVGNPKYSINTKHTLRKYGYEAIMIDGFSTYSNAKMIAKNYDIVVVVPSYASHENFWSFKDEFTQAYPSIEVLTATKDGANFIASLISEIKEQ